MKNCIGQITEGNNDEKRELLSLVMPGAHEEEGRTFMIRY